MMPAKTNVTIYVPEAVLERCRAAATSDGRSLSNYLSGLLERAHPALVHASRHLDIEEQIARPTTAQKQATARKNIAARAARLAERMSKHK